MKTMISKSPRMLDQGGAPVEEEEDSTDESLVDRAEAGQQQCHLEGNDKATVVQANPRHQTERPSSQLGSLSGLQLVERQ